MMPEESSAKHPAELKITEEAFRASQRLALAGSYAGAMMHEVNNALEALSNLIYLAKMCGDENVRRYMEIAEEQIAGLGAITRKSLAFYREEQEARDCDFIDLIESALSLHAKRISRQKINLRKRLRTPATAKVFGNEILQVLSNIILNALDALPATDAKLYVRVRCCPVRIHVTIADNGTGIDPIIQEHLFELNRTTKPHGTGFGLWLVKSIVDRHGGTIACRSSRTAGRSGTTFRVTMPLQGKTLKAV